MGAWCVKSPGLLTLNSLPLKGITLALLKQWTNLQSERSRLRSGASICLIHFQSSNPKSTWIKCSKCLNQHWNLMQGLWEGEERSLHSEWTWCPLKECNSTWEDQDFPSKSSPGALVYIGFLVGLGNLEFCWPELCRIDSEQGPKQPLRICRNAFGIILRC